MEDGTIGLFLQEWSRKVFPLLVIYRIIVFAPPLVVLHPMQNLLSKHALPHTTVLGGSGWLSETTGLHVPCEGASNGWPAVNDPVLNREPLED